MLQELVETGGGERRTLGRNTQSGLHEGIDSVQDIGQLLDENVNLDQLIEKLRREQLSHIAKLSHIAMRLGIYLFVGDPGELSDLCFAVRDILCFSWY